MVTARVRGPAPVRVVFDGQSHNGTPSSKPMPVWLMHGLGIPWANVSSGGSGWSEFTDTEARLFPQARNREGCIDVLVMNGGQGDILDAGMNGADAYQAAVDYADAARAAGFHKILVTTPPAMGPNMLETGRPTSGEQTALDGLRTLLLANGDGAFDAVVDLRVPPLDDATDTDYFQFDRLHVTEAGAEMMADLIRPALLDLMEPALPITLVQWAVAGPSTSPVTATLTGTLPGSLIVALCSGTTVAGLSPASPWALTVDASGASSAAAARHSIWSRTSPGGTVSCATTGTTNNVSVLVAEFSGVDPSATVAHGIAGDGGSLISSLPISTATSTAAHGQVLVVAGASRNNTGSSPAFTDLALVGGDRLSLGWAAVAGSAGGHSTTYTSSNTSRMIGTLGVWAP